MKTFVRLVSYIAGIVMLLGAIAAIVVGCIQTPPAFTGTGCPFSFSCSLGNVPMWVICVIPFQLMTLVFLLIVALSRRRHNNIYNQPVRRGSNYYQHSDKA